MDQELTRTELFVQWLMGWNWFRDGVERLDTDGDSIHIAFLSEAVGYGFSGLAVYMRDNSGRLAVASDRFRNGIEWYVELAPDWQPANYNDLHLDLTPELNLVIGWLESGGPDAS